MSAIVIGHKRRLAAAFLILSALTVSACSESSTATGIGTAGPAESVHSLSESSSTTSNPPSVAPDASQDDGIDDNPVTSAPSPTIDGDTIRGDVDYDYDIASSVTEAAEQATIVVAGTVTSWSDGRLVRDGDELLKHAVLEVQILDGFAAAAAADTVFLEVSRGGTLVDDTGAELKLEPGARYVQRSIDELQQAAPVGARVLVLGIPAPSDDQIDGNGDNHVLRSWKSPIASATLWAPIPQGLLFENSDGGYVSAVADQHDVEHGQWPAAKAANHTFETLLDELETTFQTR